jgi:hypothetical protein
VLCFYKINVREYRRDNQKGTIQRNGQQGCTRRRKTKQQVPETTMHKQTQITRSSERKDTQYANTNKDPMEYSLLTLENSFFTYDAMDKK